MSAGVTDQRLTKDSPPASSSTNIKALSPMMVAVTTGTRVGRREASVIGINIMWRLRRSCAALRLALGAERASDSLHARPYPEGEQHQHYTECNGIGCNQPQDRECPRPGTRDQQAAEDHRGNTRNGEPHLAFNLPAQPYGGDDLQQARGDCPDGDVVDHRQRRDLRIVERQDTDHDSGEAHEQQNPPVIVLLASTQRIGDLDDAINEQDDAQRQGQREQRDPRSREQNDSEQYPEQSAQQSHPPESRQNIGKHGVLRRVVSLVRNRHWLLCASLTPDRLPASAVFLSRCSSPYRGRDSNP